MGKLVILTGQQVHQNYVVLTSPFVVIAGRHPKIRHVTIVCQTSKEEGFALGLTT